MAKKFQRVKISEAQKENLKTLFNDLKASVDLPPSDSSLAEFKQDLKAAVSDRILTKSEFQILVQDVVEIAESAGVTPLEARTIFYDLQNIAETSRWPKTNDNATGTTGSDILWTGLGNDTLNAAGTDDAGAGEIDYLIGGGGADTFILGDPAQTFYDDDLPLTAGLVDYAAIADFNSQQDKIQLHGTASDYALAALPAELGLTGTGIYRIADSPALKELIGVVVGVTLIDLNAGFTFVSSPSV